MAFFLAEEIAENALPNPDDFVMLKTELNLLGGNMDWREELKNNITSVEQLAKVVPLSAKEAAQMEEVTRLWPMSIPRYYLGLIEKFDSSDPIFKMCIPQGVESDLDDGVLDTSGELSNTKEDGLQHKYEKTALILSTQCCAMYCRHCFRKRLVGLSESEIAREDKRIFDYIARHREICNVLVSGGDSFLNSNGRIESILSRLSEMEHIKYVRFGTRTPVSFPIRITGDPELTEILGRYRNRFGVHVVTQFNHPRELTEEAVAAIHALQDVRVSVSNQTVLLKGVNDNPEVLAELMQKLTANDIVPYYVFQCRPVTGVKQQFQVPFVKAYSIIEKCKRNLSGLDKRFRYIMSHKTGKIEIVNVDREGNAILKYHQAKKAADIGRVFIYRFGPHDCWLPDEI